MLHPLRFQGTRSPVAWLEPELRRRGMLPGDRSPEHGMPHAGVGGGAGGRAPAVGWIWQGGWLACSLAIGRTWRNLAAQLRRCLTADLTHSQMDSSEEEDGEQRQPGGDDSSSSSEDGETLQERYNRRHLQQQQQGRGKRQRRQQQAAGRKRQRGAVQEVRISSGGESEGGDEEEDEAEDGEGSSGSESDPPQDDSGEVPDVARLVEFSLRSPHAANSWGFG